MEYYVIEHPTRGFYVGHDFNDNMEWVPKFRWSISPRDDDVEKFWSGRPAEAILRTVQEHRYGRAATLKLIRV